MAATIGRVPKVLHDTANQQRIVVVHGSGHRAAAPHEGLRARRQMAAPRHRALQAGLRVFSPAWVACFRAGQINRRSRSRHAPRNPYHSPYGAKAIWHVPNPGPAVRVAAIAQRRRTPEWGSACVQREVGLNRLCSTGVVRLRTGQRRANRAGVSMNREGIGGARRTFGWLMGSPRSSRALTGQDRTNRGARRGNAVIVRRHRKLTP